MNTPSMFRGCGALIGIICFCVCLGAWFLYQEVYRDVAVQDASRTFVVEPGESVYGLSYRLEQEGIIRHARLFRAYVSLQGIDTAIHAGTYTVSSPITLSRVAAVLQSPAVQEEKEITIIPGWSLRDVARYFAEQGIASEDDVFAFLGSPAQLSDTVVDTDMFSLRVLDDKPQGMSYEGYLAPDTFRVFADASLEDIIQKLLVHRDDQFTEQMYRDIEAAGRTPFEILTMASIIEREVQQDGDMAKVSDIFWKRYDAGWPLQSDATVKYIHGLDGSVFTTAKEREVDSPWNTYVYPGLPKGPISHPGVSAIMAAIYPESNEYWYFLTTLDTGEVKYGRTLDEHNVNVARYLR
jgi:UPF0755 protein